MKLRADLHIVLAGPESFLRAFDPAGPGRYTIESPGAKLMPGDLEQGAVVRVLLELADSGVTFRHRARVAAVGYGPPEWTTLEFLPEEREIRDLVTAHCAGEKPPYVSRRRRRSAVWIPARVRVGDDWRSAILDDLSEIGAFVLLLDPPARGVEVALDVPALGEGLAPLAARVVHRRTSPPPPGCGIEFILPDRAAERRAARLVRAFLQARTTK